MQVDSSCFLGILLDSSQYSPRTAVVIMDSNTRPTLLQSLRDGVDPQAWEEFFVRYWPVIYGYAKHGGCSDHTAEDIVQEVLATVFQQRGVFRYDPQRGRFRSWLGKVVRNKIAEHRRRPAQPSGCGDDTRGHMRWRFIQERTAVRLAEALSLLCTGGHCSVHEVTGLIDHPEGAGVQVRFNVLGGAALPRNLHVVNGHRTVHRNMGNDAGFQ